MNSSGGEAKEIAEISDNTFRDLRQGVFANDSAEFVIDGNLFRDNFVGSANDATSEITDNRFIGNEFEGIGLGAPESTVTGNSFAPHEEAYVRDYTDSYDLAAMIEANEFENEVEVDETDDSIVDKDETTAEESPSGEASPSTNG